MSDENKDQEIEVDSEPMIVRCKPCGTHVEAKLGKMEVESQKPDGDRLDIKLKAPLLCSDCGSNELVFERYILTVKL